MHGRISGEATWRRVRRVAKGAVPAAGAAPTITVPGGKLWTPLSAIATVVTSAVAGSRAIALGITVANVEVARQGCGNDAAESVTFTASWWPYANSSGTTTQGVSGLPIIPLPAGSTVALSVTGGDAGDQWSALSLYVIEEDEQSGPIDLREAFGMILDRLPNEA